MRFSQFIRILRAHMTLIASVLLAAIVIAVVITFVTPYRYVATSSVLLSGNASMPASNSSLPAQQYSGYLATQMDVLTSKTVAEKVVDDLELMENPANQAKYLIMAQAPSDRIRGSASQLLARLISTWSTKKNSLEEDKDTVADERNILADRILKQVAVHPSSDSSVIQLAFTAATPRAAATAANAWVSAYLDTHLALTVNPARQSSTWLEKQIVNLTTNLQRAQQELADYQTGSGIVSADESTDVENARLNDLSSQLVAAQAQNHPAIQSLKQDLTRAEAKLNNLPPQLGTNHPQYRGVLSEVATLRKNLVEESEKLTAELRRQIAQQKAALLQTRKQWSQLSSLRDAVATAQKSLDDATQRATQTQMDSQLSQTNVSVLDQARPPRKPTAPNAMFNIALAIVLGLLIGIGLALWREVMCRYVRGIDDLRELIGVPVLGVLHSGKRSRLLQLHVPGAVPRLGNNYER